MKRILLIICIGISSSASVLAETTNNEKFFSLTYSSQVKNNADGFSMVGFNFGKKGIFTKKLGAYANFGISTNANQNGILNMGLVYPVSNRLNLLGGVGTLFTNVSDSVFSPRNSINYNAGLMYRFSKKLGVITSYNSASKTYDLGMSFYY